MAHGRGRNLGRFKIEGIGRARFSLVTFQGPMNAHRWPDILRAPRVRDTIPGVMYQSLPQFEADILQTLLGVARVFVDRECTKRINR